LRGRVHPDRLSATKRLLADLDQPVPVFERGDVPGFRTAQGKLGPGARLRQRRDQDLHPTPGLVELDARNHATSLPAQQAVACGIGRIESINPSWCNAVLLREKAPGIVQRPQDRIENLGPERT
jgi:hypothetical protein